jgi:hypothetical protein
VADSEAKIMRDIRVELGTYDDLRLFRNNVGGYWSKEGSFVRTGLAPGSGDLIGIKAVTITPDMVGTRVGVFTSVEVKSTKGRAGKKQKAWAGMVKELGGIAGFARSAKEAAELIWLYEP